MARIRNSKRGFKLGCWATVGALLYADDILLMADTEEEMEEMLNITSQVASEYGLSISDKKSKILRCGKWEESEKEGQVGGKKISETLEYIPGIQNTRRARVQDRERGIDHEEGRQPHRNVKIYTGGRAMAREWILREGWKGLVVQKLMYGVAAMPWSQDYINKMKKLENQMGRHIL